MSSKKPGKFAISPEETKEKQVPVYVNEEGLSVEITSYYEGYDLHIAHELYALEAVTLFNARAEYTKNGGLKKVTIKFPHVYDDIYKDPEEGWINSQSPTIGLRFDPLSGSLAEVALLPDEVLKQRNENFLTSPQDLTPETGENKTTLTFRWEPQQAKYKCILSIESGTYLFTAYKSDVGSQDGKEEVLFSLTLPHKVNVQQLEKALQNPQSQTPESLNLITYSGPKAEY